MEITDFLSGPKAPNYGALAKKSEKKRQGIINLGLKQLGAVYDGGDAPFYTVAGGSGFSENAWNKTGKNNQYYSINSKGNFTPFYAPKSSYNPASGFQKGTELAGSMFPGDITGDVLEGIRTKDYGQAAKNILLNAATGGVFSFARRLFGKEKKPPSVRQVVNEKLKAGQLYSAPNIQSFKGFQPEFYKAREDAYTNYALPQLADQYQDTNKAQVYGLSNTGLSDSSIAKDARYQLEKTTNAGRQQIADSAIDQGNQLRQQVAADRKAATDLLYQSSDPSRAVQQAITTSSQIPQFSTFAPIANLFGNLANQYYMNQLIKQYQQPAGQVDKTPQSYFAPIN